MSSKRQLAAMRCQPSYWGQLPASTSYDRISPCLYLVSPALRSHSSRHTGTCPYTTTPCATYLHTFSLPRPTPRPHTPSRTPHGTFRHVIDRTASYAFSASTRRKQGKPPAFTTSDVPPLSFWDARLARWNEGETAEECHDVAYRYVSLALEGTPGWRPRLETEHRIPLDRLYYVTNLLASGFEEGASTRGNDGSESSSSSLAPLPQRSPMAALVAHMWNTLVALEYPPAVMSTVRIGLGRGNLGKPYYLTAKTAFEKILRSREGAVEGEEGKARRDGGDHEYNADACTLKGFIYAKRGTKEDDARALSWFRQAYRVGTTSAKAVLAAAADSSTTAEVAAVSASNDHNDDAAAAASNSTEKQDETDEKERYRQLLFEKWQWASESCMQESRILLLRNNAVDRARATAVLKFAAEALDEPSSCFAYACLLPDDDPDRLFYLRRAAISGSAGACRELGRLETGNLETDLEKDVGQGGLLDLNTGKMSREAARRLRDRRIVAQEWFAVGADPREMLREGAGKKDP